ncbi:MAG: response regulator [Verrucomicrobiota bacterium]|nr:response regulator [Verrucomicrobiota bacterium]
MHKILIIEDDTATRSQMAQLLRFEDYDVIEADNGTAGVAAAINSMPDLIVCDIMMPELDGFGVLQALRCEPTTELIPFIFLTAKVASLDRRQGMEEGADDYLTKPYNPDALLGSIRRRLAKRALQIKDSQQKAEEVSLAAAAVLPQEILVTLERITTATKLIAYKYADEDTQVSAMHQSVVDEANRLRRVLWRLHIYAHLPQLYANRFNFDEVETIPNPTETVDRVSRSICQRWNRVRDLVLVAETAHLLLREEYFVLIVEELVDNACKFSEPGTPISVKAHAHEAFWSLTVSNQGNPMSREQISQIGVFKQFWSGNKRPQGLGLGLALTQGIARLYGCEFSLESDTEGTTATVLVPVESLTAETHARE